MFFYIREIKNRLALCQLNSIIDAIHDYSKAGPSYCIKEEYELDYYQKIQINAGMFHLSDLEAVYLRGFDITESSV